MWGKRECSPPIAMAMVFFHRTRNKSRRDGGLGCEHIAGRQGKSRLPGPCVSPWARGGIRKEIRSGRDRARHSRFPTFPGMRTRIRLDWGMWGRGECFSRYRRGPPCFPAGCWSAGTAMERSAMSAEDLGATSPLGSQCRLRGKEP